MGLAKLSTVLLVLGEASGFQIPLFSSKAQQAPVSVTGRDLISSTALQDRIDPDRLLNRAKELYHIAEAAVDEYGHPTRVIGSPGMFYSLSARDRSLLTCFQGTGEHLIISTTPSRHWAIITTFLHRTFRQ